MSKLNKDILSILSMNKYEDGYAGPYSYSDEEKATMITRYYGKKIKKLRDRIKILKNKGK